MIETYILKFTQSTLICHDLSSHKISDHHGPSRSWSVLACLNHSPMDGWDASANLLRAPFFLLYNLIQSGGDNPESEDDHLRFSNRNKDSYMNEVEEQLKYLPKSFTGSNWVWLGLETVWSPLVGEGFVLPWQLAARECLSKRWKIMKWEFLTKQLTQNQSTAALPSRPN